MPISSNRAGRAWLKHQILPDEEGAAVLRHLREFDRLGEDMAALDRAIGEAMIDSRAVRRLLTITGTRHASRPMRRQNWTAPAGTPPATSSSRRT
jgi:hypothetical protein